MSPLADDDFYDPQDDFYEEDEDNDDLSPEDKVALANGTEEVKRMLDADASKVSVSQIEEALWHYYYDVEKSVAYLRRTFIAPTPKKTPKKTLQGEFVARFPSLELLFAFEKPPAEDLGGYEQRECRHIPGALRLQMPPFPISEAPQIPMDAYFFDMPWQETPLDRQTTFFAPLAPPGGLLGGSDDAPKLSKLQILAAARKKKNEQRKEQERGMQMQNGLQDLSISSDKPNGVAQPTLADEPAPVVPIRKATQSNSDTSIGPDTLDFGHPMHDAEVHVSTTGQRSAPSAFARTLTGSAKGQGQSQQQDVFVMTYTFSSSYFASAFSEPSPDDIVLAAQAKAGKKATPPASKTTPKKKTNGAALAKSDPTTDNIAKKVSGLEVKDAPPPKSKGLDVVKEYEQSNLKQSASFVVVGHVDAGKSTLMGRLLVDLKYVQQRTVDKYKRLAEKSGKQSFALAWVMDQRTEERERGVTIDIATNYFETDKTKFTILDAPGHRDFVPNMIAGASQADFAVLVIDSNTGAYEKGLKGQTREHILLLRSLGLQRVIVAVNKLDMVGWSKERFQDIIQEVTGFLTGLGFQEKHVDCIPISGLDGENIVEKITAPAASWYQGATLLEALERCEPTTIRAVKKPYRMAISEIFRSQQQGMTTLAGRIESGTIQIGDSLVVQPSGETAYIKSILVDTESKDWAVAGQNVSMALTDIDPIHLRVGDILCHAASPIPCSDSFTMKAMAFDHLLPMPIDLHRGRLHTPGQIQSIAALLDKATGQVIKKRPKVVQPGGVARVMVQLNEKVPLEAGQRVVMRSGGETIAAGLVE